MSIVYYILYLSFSALIILLIMLRLDMPQETETQAICRKKELFLDQPCMTKWQMTKAIWKIERK